MQANDLRNKSVEDLKTELSNLQREQFNLRFQLKTGQLQQTDNVRKVVAISHVLTQSFLRN